MVQQLAHITALLQAPLCAADFYPNAAYSTFTRSVKSGIDHPQKWQQFSLFFSTSLQRIPSVMKYR